MRGHTRSCCCWCLVVGFVAVRRRSRSICATDCTRPYTAARARECSGGVMGNAGGCRRGRSAEEGAKDRDRQVQWTPKISPLRRERQRVRRGSDRQYLFLAMRHKDRTEAHVLCSLHTKRVGGTKLRRPLACRSRRSLHCLHSTQSGRICSPKLISIQLCCRLSPTPSLQAPILRPARLDPVHPAAFV